MTNMLSSRNHKKTNTRILSPTTKDIAFAAGLYEGEGSCSKATSENAQVYQKDTEILYWLRDRFGGSVRTYNRKEKAPNSLELTLENRQSSMWYVSGARARGFLMTIYWFLSTRRKEQIEKLGFLNVPAKIL